MKKILGHECHDQHDLMQVVMFEAGGVNAETLLPSSSTSKIVDVSWPYPDVLCEIKSITVNRPTVDSVQTGLGEVLSKDAPKFGGPILFGRGRINTSDVPPETGANMLRKIGEPVYKDLKKANKQIKESRIALDRADAHGVVAIICPPHELDLEVLGWVVWDATREGKLSAVQHCLVAQTPLLAPFGDYKNLSSALTCIKCKPDAASLNSWLPSLTAAWTKAHNDQPPIFGIPPKGWHGQTHE